MSLKQQFFFAIYNTNKIKPISGNKLCHLESFDSNKLYHIVWGIVLNSPFARLFRLHHPLSLILVICMALCPYNTGTVFEQGDK